MGSVYKDRGVRCVCADVPFLTNFPLTGKIKTEATLYIKIVEMIKKMKNPSDGWHTIGFIDTMAHAFRMKVPVMLVAGGNDFICPPGTIQSLFEKLPSTKMYCLLEGQGHAHTIQFAMLSLPWFRLYA